ncbi:Cap-associated protein CAF20 [Scheffersomyces xylosifermentans]|uniref:Cap-associated protein CAF20 n=1 Tax=Scheffersomyces xylosifermentans TaxID=1304137 RepID=UPI00315CB390
MVKYTEERLLEIKEEAYVPQPQILEAFNAMIEEVKEHAAAEYEKHKSIKWNNGDTYIDERGNERPYHHMNRRRASRTGNKPNLRKKSVENVQVDEDGWATLTKPKKSFGAEEGEEERSKFRESLKEGGKGGAVRAKPNNKNLGSSKAVDPRDAIADKQTITFNAFEALGDGDDDDSDDE